MVNVNSKCQKSWMRSNCYDWPMSTRIFVKKKKKNIFLCLMASHPLQHGIAGHVKQSFCKASSRVNYVYMCIMLFCVFLCSVKWWSGKTVTSWPRCTRGNGCFTQSTHPTPPNSCRLPACLRVACSAVRFNSMFTRQHSQHHYHTTVLLLLLLSLLYSPLICPSKHTLLMFLCSVWHKCLAYAYVSGLNRLGDILYNTAGVFFVDVFRNTHKCVGEA